MKQKTLEICAGSLSSAIAAQTGGANRVELCDNLAEGGTTPSPGMILQVVKMLKIPVFVLIRPRAGDFLYSEAEFSVIKEDILFCKEHGAKGVVFGILNEDGTVDMNRNAELVHLARPMQVTFHRAFDMSRDPIQAMEDIISLGFERILTSGQAANAPDGAAMIAELIKRAAGRIIIMPGGGITENNITELCQKTGAVEFHASLRNPVRSLMQFKNKKAYMGTTGKDEYSWMETDPEKVRKVVTKMYE
jgi:copper homeostasis protein